MQKALGNLFCKNLLTYQFLEATAGHPAEIKQKLYFMTWLCNVRKDQLIKNRLYCFSQFLSRVDSDLFFWNAFKHNIQICHYEMHCFFLKRTHLFIHDFCIYVHDLSCTAQMKEFHAPFPVPDVLGSSNHYFSLVTFLHSFCCRRNENTEYGGKWNLACWLKYLFTNDNAEGVNA